MQPAGSQDLLCAVRGSYTDWRRCDICPGEEINVTQYAEHRELGGQRARVLPPDWKDWKHQGRGTEPWIRKAKKGKKGSKNVGKRLIPRLEESNITGGDDERIWLGR